MTSRKLIGVAVTAACAILSVNATAQTVRSAEAQPSSHPVRVQEVITPFSVNESGPSWPMADTRRAPERTAAYVSLPNPQTPFSPNESGPVNYAKEMREHAQHVASVTQTRVNVARIESERLAAIERERVEAERERLAALERERLERERLAAAQTSPAGDASLSAAPVGGTSSTAGGSSAAVNAPVDSSGALSTAPAPVPVPAPQREAQADPNAALVDTRSMLGAGATPQTNNVVGSPPSPAPSEASADISADARRPDAPAQSTGLTPNTTSIGASGTVTGGGMDGGHTPRDNSRLMLDGANTDATPR